MIEEETNNENKDLTPEKETAVPPDLVAPKDKPADSSVRTPDMTRKDPPSDGYTEYLSVPSRKKVRRKRKKRNAALTFTIITVILLLWGSFAFWYYYPSTLEAEYELPGLIVNGEVYEQEHYKVIGDSLFLRYDTANQILGSTLFYEPETARVILTTSDEIIEMRTDQLTAYVNYEPVDLDIPIHMEEDIPYVSVDYLGQIYKFTSERYENGVYDINNSSRSYLIVKALKDTYIRELADFRSPRITSVSEEELVSVYEEVSGWYKVRNSLGLLGYVDKDHFVLERIVEAVPLEEEPFSPPWQPIGDKINLTWDYMSRPKTDMSAYETIPGLNVISPTWFHLLNGEGEIKSDASLEYVEWAHSEGLQVWALFDNGFDPDFTRGVLRDFDKRRKVISYMLMQAKLLGIDGINIDFENVYYEDKDYLTQFVREFAIMLHEQDLTVSMDVTVLSTNPDWSMVFDRPNLSKAVDYMAVMTYDEHWASSPKAGSVGSIPWVRSSLDSIIEQIPPEKILMGIPLYTRLWEEIPQDDGSVKVSSKAYSMNGIRNILSEQETVYSFDNEAGQNYAEYTENGNIYKVWLEDEVSLRERVRIMKEYSLAGIATWRKGFEDDRVWSILTEEISKKP